jgi:hypothetical protein
MSNCFDGDGPLAPDRVLDVYFYSTDIQIQLLPPVSSQKAPKEDFDFRSEVGFLRLFQFVESESAGAPGVDYFVDCLSQQCRKLDFEFFPATHETVDFCLDSGD